MHMSINSLSGMAASLPLPMIHLSALTGLSISVPLLFASHHDVLSSSHVSNVQNSFHLRGRENFCPQTADSQSLEHPQVPMKLTMPGGSGAHRQPISVVGKYCPKHIRVQGLGHPQPSSKAEECPVGRVEVPAHLPESWKKNVAP